MKQKIRRILAFIIVFAIIAAPIRALAAYDEDEDDEAGDFVINVVITEADGKDSYTANVTVTNNGKDFSGEVMLSMYRNYGSSFGVSKTVSIAAGATENISLPFMLPLNISAGEINGIIELKTTSGKRVSYVHFKKVMAGAGIRIGILSDEPGAFAFFNGYSDYIGAFNQSGESTFTTVPVEDATNTDFLENIPYLIIDRYDTTKLSDEVIKGIENWVKAGGILIIGTGNTDKTFAGFSDDFIDVTASYENDGSIQVYMDMYDAYANDEEVGIEKVILFPGNGYSQSGTSGISALKPTGTGVIEILDFSITDTNLNTEWIASNLLADPAGINGSTNNTYSVSPMDPSDMEDVFGIMQGKGGINVALMDALMTLYIALVGPIIYLILKAMKKREYIWIAVPAVALVFTGFIYLASLGFTVKNKQFRNITLSVADGSTDTESLIMGFDTVKKRWTVDLDESIKTAGVRYVEGYSNSGEPDAYVSYKPSGVSISYKPISTFAEVYFKGKSHNNTSGGMTLDAEYDMSYITAKLTNNTGVDFDYLLIVSDGGYKVIEPGKNKNIDMHEIAKNYSGFRDVLRDAEDLYDKRQYKVAAYYAALSYAAAEINSPTFAVGIKAGEQRLVKGNANEKTYNCYYVVME